MWKKERKRNFGGIFSANKDIGHQQRQLEKHLIGVIGFWRICLIWKQIMKNLSNWLHEDMQLVHLGGDVESPFFHILVLSKSLFVYLFGVINHKENSFCGLNITLA